MEIELRQREDHRQPHGGNDLQPSATRTPRTQVRPVAFGPNSWSRKIVAGLIGVGLIVGVTIFLRGGASAQSLDARLTHAVTRGELLVTVTEDGSLESSRNKEIKCRVKGGSTVLWIIKPGTLVKPGDVLVRLDTSTIEDNINAQRIRYQNALALVAQSESDVAIAKINIEEFQNGTFVVDKNTLLKDIKLAESQVVATEDSREYARRMHRKGYANSAQLEASEDEFEHAKIELDVLKTQLEVLERYTKAKKSQEFLGILKSKEAKLESDKAALDLEKDRLNRIEEQLKNCVIEADTAGLVIFPTTEQWKNQPNIEEGATVREDQVLLMIPDLDQMQVKLGVHEAYVDRLKPGMKARIQLQGETVDGEILSVASVTRPAGWWNGNQVKYETIIKLDSADGLKPGMSASVEVELARYADVLTVPVAAVVEQDGQFFCWVRGDEGVQRRRLDVGDSNDQFIEVKGGVSENDQVILNPRAYVKQAQSDALKPLDSKNLDPANKKSVDKPKVEVSNPPRNAS